MPRVAQTLDSKDKMQAEGVGAGESEEETTESDRQTLANMNNNDFNVTHAVESFEIIPSRTTNSSQNSSAFNSYDEDNEDDENSPLRVIIGGMVKKFKKDSRVWLHKSSAKIKRGTEFSVMEEGKIHNLDDRGDNQIRITVSLSDTMVVGDAENCDMGSCHVRGENMSESTVSVIGDSDADLSYSEEETEETLYSAAPCKGSLSFYKQDNGECEIQERLPEAMEVDEVSSEVQITKDRAVQACKCKVTPCDVTYCKCEQKESATPETFSKSTEHDISFKRLAPAIAQEDESLKESLLDYAVNHFGKQHTGTKKILSGRVFKRVKRKVFSAQARRKEGVPSPTRLPTCMCASPRVTRQRQDRLTGREECLRHFNRCLTSLSSIHNDESRESLGYTPSLDTTLVTTPRQVPSLLLMAASALNLGTRKNIAETNGTDKIEDKEDNTK